MTETLEWFSEPGVADTVRDINHACELVQFKKKAVGNRPLSFIERDPFKFGGRDCAADKQDK